MTLTVARPFPFRQGSLTRSLRAPLHPFPSLFPLSFALSVSQSEAHPLSSQGLPHSFAKTRGMVSRALVPILEPEPRTTSGRSAGTARVGSVADGGVLLPARRPFDTLRRL